MEILIALVIVAVVAWVVTAPLRSSEQGGVEPVSTADPALAALEAAKQAKYREIRDTELDHAQGKLTEADFRRQDAELRAEAIEILKRIDAHRADAVEGADESENRRPERDSDSPASG
jgi:hypothetical protein